MTLSQPEPSALRHPAPEPAPEPAPAPGCQPARRSSPSWTGRRGIPALEVPDHAPWLRLHEHLAVRYGIRADLPRRWERPSPGDVFNLGALLRQSARQVDRDLCVALAEAAPGLTPDAVDLLRRVRDKVSAGVNLAEYLALSEQQVSRLLADLTERGLVHREPGWRDLRTRRAELTDDGVEVLDRVEAIQDVLLGGWLEGLDQTEVSAFLHLLHALCADRPRRSARRSQRSSSTPSSSRPNRVTATS